MNNVELEEEAPVAELGMRDGERAGGEPARQAQAKAPELNEIMRGAEDQRVFLLLRMSFSENRFPPRIKSGTGFFRDMR